MQVKVAEGKVLPVFENGRVSKYAGEGEVLSVTNSRLIRSWLKAGDVVEVKKAEEAVSVPEAPEPDSGSDGSKGPGKKQKPSEDKKGGNK